jgi:hypothetical protein
MDSALSRGKLLALKWSTNKDIVSRSSYSQLPQPDFQAIGEKFLEKLEGIQCKVMYKERFSFRLKKGPSIAIYMRKSFFIYVATGHFQICLSFLTVFYLRLQYIE